MPKAQSRRGKGKPAYAEMTVCWVPDEAEARRTAFECWPNAAITGELSQILPVPAHFEQAAKMLKEEDVAKDILCGADAERYLKKLDEYIQAGYTQVWVHQVGQDQEGFSIFINRRFCRSWRNARLHQRSLRPKSRALRLEKS